MKKLLIGNTEGKHLSMLTREDTWNAELCVYCSVEDLNNKILFATAISNRWEQVILDLRNEKSPRLHLSYFKKHNTEVLLPDKVDRNLLKFLSEMFPEKSGEIRKAIAMGKKLEL